MNKPLTSEWYAYQIGNKNWADKKKDCMRVFHEVDVRSAYSGMEREIRLTLSELVANRISLETAVLEIKEQPKKWFPVFVDKEVSDE